jgi:integrase
MSDEIVVKVNSYGLGRPLSLVYIDPVSGRKKAKSAGTSDWREAERLAGELEKELRAGRYVATSKTTWAEFRQRYEQERLTSLSKSARCGTATVFNYMERVLHPDRLVKLTTQAMSRFVALLRKAGMKDSTLACHLRHLRASLGWAKRMGLLAEIPQFDMPKAGDAKGRPVTSEEFDRIILAVSKARPHDADVWQRIITGLWLSGLRREEAVILSWEPDAPFAVDLTGKYPSFRIEAKAQKGRRDERLPMTPDCAEFLLATPENERVGRVFGMPRLLDGQPMTAQRAGETISRICRTARIIVARDPDTGKVKYASAHDLRRSFGTRWAKRVMPAVLQRLMRHRNINTTMKYYVGIEADDVAADLWAKHPGPGNTFGNNRPESSVSPAGANGTPEAVNPCGKSN